MWKNVYKRVKKWKYIVVLSKVSLRKQASISSNSSVALNNDCNAYS